MKKTNLILIMTLLTSSFGYVRAGENENHKVGQSTKALLSRKIQNDIKWTGIVVQTVNNSNSTCFQIVETEPFEGEIPKYQVLEDDSRFIACQAGQLDAKDYDGRLLTVSGDIVSFYSSKSKNGDYSIIETSDIKVWRLKRSYDSHNHYYGISYNGGARSPDSYSNVNVGGSYAPPSL